MERLVYVFSRLRRGHPAPNWRVRPYRPTIDIRLAEMDDGPVDHDRSSAGDVAPARIGPRRELWER